LRLTRRGAQLRPFCLAAGVRHQGYSRPLQRVLTDFGAEASFQAATLRVKEHYGVLVPISALRQQTLRHGRAITALADPQKAQAASQLITEMDGSMIPVMEPGGGHDRRKGKRLFWREVKLCCARPVGSVQTRYGATLGNATAGYGRRSPGPRGCTRKPGCMAWATAPGGSWNSSPATLASKALTWWTFIT